MAENNTAQQSAQEEVVNIDDSDSELNSSQEEQVVEEAQKAKKKSQKKKKKKKQPEINIGELLERLIISEALFQKASDVHIEPRENDVIVRYRIDGLLREILTLDKDLQNPLIFKIKVMAKLRTDEHFAPQDGRIRFEFESERLDTRVSILPTTKGEKIVFRLLTSTRGVG